MNDRHRLVKAGDIIDSTDVRRLAGGVTRATLLRWRARPDFPPPLRTTGSGVDLFARPDIRTWLRENVGHRAGDGTLTRGN